MNRDLFDGIKQWEFESKGIKGKLPVFYYDNTSVTAIYTASTDKVKELLPHPDMRPIELYRHKCLAVFTAFEYRKSDIGPYNECSIAFPIAFGKRQIPGITVIRQMVQRCFTAYVWQLPVTTEIARIGGVEMYGLPKFIADISFKKEQGWIACMLSEGNEKILSLRGKILPTRRGKVSRAVIYSMIDDIPLVANVLVDPIEFAQTRDKQAASLELGTVHPISKTLAGIGLGRNPVAYQYCPITRAILFAARNLMDH
jgi:hypothetical protein